MVSRSSSRRVLAPFLVAGTLAVVTAQEADYHRPEVGVQAGFFLPDQDLSNKDSTIQELEPEGGVRFAWLFARHLDWFVDTTFTDINTNTAAGDIETQGLRTGIDVYFRPHTRKVQWFVALGGGVIDIDAESAENFDRNFASVGIGQRVRLDSRANFRWELRGDQIFDDDDLLEGEDVTRTHFLIGVNWGLGRSHRDSDGDGVPDRRDDCPDTPDCAIVDERGCPIDSDGDGVWDGCDRCPGTPDCAVVGEDGCPIDSDGDGVPDGCDKCPGTPDCATVDETGCPIDSDGDGVPDGCDQCPDTPDCATVDPSGCPGDSDGDGVWDGCDDCPDTPPGTTVRPDGCPKVAPLFTGEQKTLILEGVFFEFDRAVLRPESRDILDRVARSLMDWPEVHVEVAGHTDSIGTDEYNRDLSGRRAATVVEYLRAQGVAIDRMRAHGYGESQPIADNRDDGGRAKNRRVELKKLD